MGALESRKMPRRQSDMTLKLYIENAEIGKNFEAVKESLPCAGLLWLNDLRTSAMEKFLDAGIPGPKVEEWKYTNLGFLANENFSIAHKTSHESEVKAYFYKAYIATIKGPVIVFVNGYMDKGLSQFPEDGDVIVDSFSDKPELFKQDLANLEGAGSLDNLNRAMVTDGYSLRISENSEPSQPLQIIHIVTSGTDMQSLRTRAQIKLARGSKA